MRQLIGSTVVGLSALALLAATPGHADPLIDPEAEQVLGAMSRYLGALPSFAVRYDVDIDVITPDAEKVQFSSSGDLVLQRPDKLHATRRGAVAEVELFVDGTSVTMLGKKANVFLQLPAASIDAAIEALRSETSIDAPAADLLSSHPLASDVTDIVSARHVGMAYIGNVAVHHLAFRGSSTDWQLWVQDGPQPVPLRYVITSKWIAGAPQYSLRLHDWDLQPTIDQKVFSFVPPAGAKRLSSVTVDETGEFLEGGE